MPLKLNKFLLGVFGLFVVSIAACDEEIEEKKIDTTKTVFVNTCEPNQIWSGEETISKNEIKRGGEYSSKMTKEIEFGMGLRKRCDEISEFPPKKVVAGVWINCPEVLKGGQIVISIDDEKGNVFWSGFPINKSIKKQNEWIYCENTIEFPMELNAKNYVSIYVWNPEKELFYLDDWKIEFSN